MSRRLVVSLLVDRKLIDSGYAIIEGSEGRFIPSICAGLNGILPEAGLKIAGV